MIAWQSPEVPFEPYQAAIARTASESIPDTALLVRQAYVVNPRLREPMMARTKVRRLQTAERVACHATRATNLQPTETEGGEQLRLADIRAGAEQT